MRLRDQMGGAFDSAGFEYGDELSHSWIDAAAGIKYPSIHDDDMTDSAFRKEMEKCQFERMAAVEALKEYCLTERLMYLRSIVGYGYRVVRSSDQTEAAVEDGMTMVARGFDKTLKGLRYTNTSCLTPAEVTRHAEVTAKFGTLQVFVSRKRRRIMRG